MPRYTKSRRKTSSKVEWFNAPDVKKRVIFLVKRLDITWIRASRLFCFRSQGANSRALARIWGFSRVWQKALRQPPAYIIEVLSEKFDHLPQSEQDKILIHEVAHIPKNFSGSLLPHTRRRKGNFHDKLHEFLTQLDKLQSY